MASTSVSTVDRQVLTRAAASIRGLVAAPEVGAAWGAESALPGMSVGGLARHLVSQVECAVEFLTAPRPPQEVTAVSLAELYRRADWFTAPADAEENTSVRDEVNALAVGGHRRAVELLDAATAQLPVAAAAAGPVTYVPWQDCFVSTEDFLLVRTMEVLVHADDLAVSAGVAVPVFEDDVAHPVAALLGLLVAVQHGTATAVRALARPERSGAPRSAFSPPAR